MKAINTAAGTRADTPRRAAHRPVAAVALVVHWPISRRRSESSDGPGSRLAISLSPARNSHRGQRRPHSHPLRSTDLVGPRARLRHCSSGSSLSALTGFTPILRAHARAEIRSILGLGPLPVPHQCRTRVASESLCPLFAKTPGGDGAAPGPAGSMM